MTESTRLVDLVQANIDDFVDDREPQLLGIAPDLEPYLEYSRALLSGGKRFRALFCYWGWESVAGNDTPASDLDAIVKAASALELFHAAALVHDDIIDNSDTRRGQPAAHRRFEQLLRQNGWDGDADTFGRSGALLLGDLLLGWSDELFDLGLSLLGDRGSATAARREFNRMRTDVTCGQYLDILEERSWRSHEESQMLERAHRVIVHKSARYSVEAPLAVGALLGGGSLEQLSSLREFGLPLGIAYQLRDDLLGVFGDPAQTGKPSGDDLREGKRTVLIAIARQKLPGTAARLLDELLGDPDLSEHQIATLQASLKHSGAVDEVERIIDHNVALARTALAGASISDAARAQLGNLVDAVTRRSV